MGESDTLRRRRRAAPLVRMDGRVTGSRLQAPHQDEEYYCTASSDDDGDDNDDDDS
ncbi:hypothetical protein [Oryza sativa Japonica Group]|uniref:Uncharacterized protein n=2 Tax=Oryza sativa subsp. japonica TaxID=39947 RepID=Q5ZD34_ORYSJ|nr:hypothetical protein [Oryza sativa Japonica Group]BAD52893.1 hypothetical protein [Oryza sativa Japonica Group]